MYLCQNKPIPPSRPKKTQQNSRTPAEQQKTARHSQLKNTQHANNNSDLQQKQAKQNSSAPTVLKTRPIQ
jgi:hypothetical protein